MAENYKDKCVIRLRGIIRINEWMRLYDSWKAKREYNWNIYENDKLSLSTCRRHMKRIMKS